MTTKKKGRDLSKTKKYDPVERMKIRKRILALAKSNVPTAAMVPVLNSEGFRTPDGKKLTQTHVNNQLYAARRVKKTKAKRNAARRAKSPRTPAPTVVASKADMLPPVIKMILTSEETPAAKVAAMREFYGV